MSQQDVIDLLKQQPDKWWTSKELQDKLKIGMSATTNNIRALREHGDVDSKRVKGSNNQEIWVIRHNGRKEL